ncbi:MAG TPA: helix-hairpin-helix domain-containing protein [Mucilaginibacter sp.]|nr:helix-hairpin-helix domain-containing protein [Mucilaginibacter sp.]
MISRIRSYLSVSKKEWNGMVVLVILIALILAAPYVFQLFRKDTTIIDPKEFNKAVAILEKAQKKQPGNHAAATTFYKKAAPGEVVELNTADSATLTELKGIGPSFARRIVGYRNRLGGFWRKEQLLEVYGLDSDRYAGLQAEVSVDPSNIKKIPVNSVNFETLSRFPYLSYKQTNAIIQFREQHGPYESLADLQNIAIMDNNTIQKIKPYIIFK